MATTLRSLTVWFRARTGDFQRKVKGARRSMHEFRKSAQSVQNTLSRLKGLLLGGMGLYVLARGIRSVVTSWGNYEKALAKINTVLKTTNSLMGFTRDELREYANELQELSGVAGSKFLNTMAILGTFVSITGDEFKLATKAAGDLAHMFDQDMAKAAVQLGKALSDANRGLTALRRVGVIFTESEVARAKELFAAGRMKEYQQLVLSVVMGINGVRDAMEQFRQTSAGAIQALITQWGVWKKNIGEQVTPVIVVLAEELAKLGPVGKSVGEVVVDAMESIAMGGAQAWRVIQILIIGLKTMYAAALGGLGKVIEAMEWIDRALPGEHMVFPGQDVGTSAKHIPSLRDMMAGKEKMPERQLVKISEKLAAMRVEMIKDINKEADDWNFGENIEDQMRELFRKIRERAEDFREAMNQPLPPPPDWWTVAIEEHAKIWNAHVASMASSGAKVFEATRTPLEKYEATLQRLSDLLKVGVLGEGAEGWETYGRAVRKAREEVEKAIGTTEKAKVKAEKLQLAGAREVGAGFRGHAAAFRQANPAVAVAQQQLKVQEDMRGELERIEENTKLKAPVADI